MQFVWFGRKSRPEIAEIGDGGVVLLDETSEPEANDCHGSQQITAGAGQIASQLLASRADVHVDFHAHLHFDDLRSFPGHSGLPSSWRTTGACLTVRPRRARCKSSCKSRVAHLS